jgi:large subunit ribosomal protein L4
MELTVYNISGEETTKKINLDDKIFGIEPNDHAIYLDCKQYMANKRQGTHKSKERSEISGSTRKLKRQKGTGGARSGDIKSPVFVGGGRVFGPRPRDYNFKLNKKVKVLARKSALTYKVREDGIIIIEDINFENHKTKNYIQLLNNFNIFDKKTLLILAEENKNVYLSSRNIKQANITSTSNINTYEILKAQKLLITESSISKISEMFGKEI